VIFVDTFAPLLHHEDWLPTWPPGTGYTGAGRLRSDGVAGVAHGWQQWLGLPQPLAYPVRPAPECAPLPRFGSEQLVGRVPGTATGGVCCGAVSADDSAVGADRQCGGRRRQCGGRRSGTLRGRWTYRARLHAARYVSGTLDRARNRSVHQHPVTSPRATSGPAPPVAGTSWTVTVNPRRRPSLFRHHAVISTSAPTGVWSQVFHPDQSAPLVG
jgi:hypothetical protein